MRFEWDDNKNLTNILKHGISFEEAVLVFDDPFHISKLDKRFSYYEERWITLGQTKNNRLVVAIHLYFDSDEEEVVRIISARKATANERNQYER